MRVIETNGQKLAVVFGTADFPQGLGFLTEAEDFLQVGTWRYPAGTELAAHNHQWVSRTVERTQEFVWVVQGRLAATVYDEEDRPVAEVELGPGQGMILLAGGHGYRILEDDTRVVEVKSGPYPGAEADRRRL